MKEKNDIYGREKKLKALLEDIRESKNANRDILLEYERSMRLDGIGTERREKVIRTLFLISKWQPLPFAGMGRKEVEDIVERIENFEGSEWTKHDYKVVLKKFFKWMRHTEFYPDEVRWIKAGNIKNGKLPEEMLTEEEVKRMIDCAESPRDKALISVLFESGCRVGELCSLKIKDVVFDEKGCVVIFPSGKTGARRVRVIFSTPFISTWIANHPYRDPEGWLWVNTGQINKGQPMNYAGVRKMLISAAGRAGIRKAVNPHNFRHSRATLLASSLTESQMNEYLGWIQGSKIPQVYVHLSGRDVDDAILKMNGLESGEEKKKESPLKAVKCPRCGNISTGNFCYKCGAVLNVETAIELQDRTRDVDEKLASLLEDREIRELLIRKMKGLA